MAHTDSSLTALSDHMPVTCTLDLSVTPRIAKGSDVMRINTSYITDPETIQEVLTLMKQFYAKVRKAKTAPHVLGSSLAASYQMEIFKTEAVKIYRNKAKAENVKENHKKWAKITTSKTATSEQKQEAGQKCTEYNKR